MRWRGFRVEIPDGWRAGIRADAVCLYPSEYQAESELEAAWFDSVWIFDRGARATSLEASVESFMGRRLPTSAPPGISRRFCGEPAIEYEWGDGLSALWSLFLMLGNRLFEIQRVVPLLSESSPSGRDAESRELYEAGVSVAGDGRV